MHKRIETVTTLIKNLRLSSYFFEERCRQCGQPVPTDAEQQSPPGSCLCVGCNLLFTSDRPSAWLLTADGIACDGERAGSASGLRVCTAATYAGPIQKLIRRLKYDDDTLVAKDIGPKLFLAFQLLCQQEVDLQDSERTRIVPIPLHRKRQLHRGYNQAHLIAKEFARLANLQVETRMLRRTKQTKPQYGLKKAERLINVKDAFELGKTPVSGLKIILVDDVFTSGATLLACASLLCAAGAAKVVAVAAARAPYDRDKNTTP